MKQGVLLIFLFMTVSCSILKKEGQWGTKAGFPVKGERILYALKKNVSSPHFWAPLASAGIISVSGLDGTLSKFASESHLLTSDHESTDKLSDRLNTILEIERYASIFVASSWNEDDGWGGYALSKLRGGVVTELSARSTKPANDSLRSFIHRRRPDHSDHRSLPSGHATEASTSRALIARNLDSSRIDESAKKVVNAVNGAITGAVMWARVEARRHYPSDVLAGYSVGYFVSSVIYDSLMNLESNQTFSFIPMKDKMSLLYTVHY